MRLITPAPRRKALDTLVVHPSGVSSPKASLSWWRRIQAARILIAVASDKGRRACRHRSVRCSE